MTTIDPDQNVVTLVNVFTVEPADQQRLLDLLDRATEDVMQHLPGFVSANLHAGLDGTHVVNYAQWRSVEDFQAMLESPLVREHMDAAAELATVEPNLYRVHKTFLARQ
ncbi:MULTISPECIES: antibiotic biosynthesis monooxygenase [unclassified Nocardia]|uniref:antibiotic biosynthesis monooxygenase family protein n=1 Tax=unclassified Nocardia TaxID=2637762 RepID=UPI001CE4AC8A|nr:MULTISPECIES: antibiotic biosynthesis monooxygenase family protein [unclassified Nocardia]